MSSVSHPCIAVVDRIVVISSLFSSLSHFSGPVLMFFHYTLAFCCIVCIKHLGNSHCEALVAMGHEVRASVLYISVGLVIVWWRDISSNMSIVEPAHPCIQHICLAWINYRLSPFFSFLTTLSFYLACLFRWCHSVGVCVMYWSSSRNGALAKDCLSFVLAKTWRKLDVVGTLCALSAYKNCFFFFENDSYICALAATHWPLSCTLPAVKLRSFSLVQ